ncbi:hypothetical protein V2J09_018133 [Rumex salicifolius]
MNADDTTFYNAEQGEAPSPNSRDDDDDGHQPRTGTVLTASSHIITAVIGSGVLSLAWCIAQLGWLLGPAILIAFSLITFMTSAMLADCYRSPVTGTRNYTYSQVVHSYLGGSKFKVYLCRLAQYSNCAGVSIGYTITASISMVAVVRSDCYHKHGHNNVGCQRSHYPFMTAFGIIQIVLSQIPNFHKLSWLSLVAAVMSFSYSSIGFGLSVAKVISDGGHTKTRLGGTEVGVDVTMAQKIWRSCQAIGDMAFSYAYSGVLIEIQDTLKSSPPENRAMKAASLIGVSTTTLFYLFCGCIGYAAFGNKAPGNFLTDFGFYDPYWLVDFANACIAVHLIGAYQVFVQPLFGFVESTCQQAWPQSEFINRNHLINIPCVGVYPLNLFRLTWRTIYVIITAVTAMLLPFFNSFLGLIGAVAFWPLTVYLPIEMHIVQKNVKRGSLKWVFLKLLTVVCFFVCLVAAVGSVEGLVTSVQGYKLFE